MTDKKNPFVRFTESDSGIWKPKTTADLAKQERWFNDPTTKHATESRVQDHLVGTEADPLAGLAHEKAKKIGKRPLPPPHAFLSEANRNIRMRISMAAKRRRVTERLVDALVDEVLAEMKETIYDSFEFEPGVVETLKDAAMMYVKNAKINTD